MPDDSTPSIRETLAEAMKTATEPDPAEIPADEPVSVPEGGEADGKPAPVEGGAKGDRPRDPATGKFLPKEPATGQAGQSSGQKDMAGQKPEDAPAKDPGPAESVDLPHTLPENWKADLRKLPVEAQKIFADRYRQMEADYTRKTMELRPYREVAEFFAPHAHELAMAGLTPAQVIQRWAAAERMIQSDPVNAITRLAGLYLDPQNPNHAAFLQALQGMGQSGEEEVDPRIRQLEQRIAQMQQALGAVGGYQQQQVVNSALAQVQAFAEAAGPDGQKLHPFMDDPEVVREMAARAKFIRDQGRTPDLEQIYQEVVWASPHLRPRMIEAEVQRAKAEAAAKAAEEARKQAERAARAGASVRGAPAPGLSPSQPQSLREELEGQARRFGFIQ